MRAQRQFAIEQVSHTPDDGKPKPKTLGAIALGVAQLIIFLEDALLLVLRNSPPGIPYLY